MTTSLRAQVSAQLGWNCRDYLGEMPVVNRNTVSLSSDLYDSGTDLSADLVWHDANVTLADAETLDLSLEALTQSLFGDTITLSFARVKALLIVHRNTTGTAALVVGGAPSNAWEAPMGASGDQIQAMPGSPLLLSHLRTGWEVTSTSKVLRLAASGGSVTFDIAILGTASSSSSSSSSGV
jgi:hypothetical protein